MPLVDFDYIDRNPMRKIKQLRNDRRTIDFITDSQFESLMRNMDVSKYHEYRDKVIMELLLDSGMRVGDCLFIVFWTKYENIKHVSLSK